MRQKISDNLRRAPGGVATEENITEELMRVVTEKKKEIRGRSKWRYVPTDSSKPLPSSIMYTQARIT